MDILGGASLVAATRGGALLGADTRGGVLLGAAGFAEEAPDCGPVPTALRDHGVLACPRSAARLLLFAASVLDLAAADGPEPEAAPAGGVPIAGLDEPAPDPSASGRAVSPGEPPSNPPGAPLPAGGFQLPTAAGELDPPAASVAPG
ncbi:hypothetical protein ACLMAL_11450 [Nocardia sp. CWNU-33]|uniref:hypothetical protein n=1 Tax=Nocardia sp. CWNU-33 TaxID=3392117 RepID=UPI00398F314D